METRIYLLGMPASGKTTWGQRLAERLGYRFVDLDWEVARREGMPIPQLFAERGEAYFREAERRALLEVLPQQAVVATGGGAPCFFDNMEALRRQGLTVFLDVPLETLAGRAWARKGERPLLNGASFEQVRGQLAETMAWRRPFYERAHVIADAALLGRSDGVEALLKRLAEEG